jgi:hypothetical protein
MEEQDERPFDKYFHINVTSPYKDGPREFHTIMKDSKVNNMLPVHNVTRFKYNGRYLDRKCAKCHKEFLMKDFIPEDIIEPVTVHKSFVVASPKVEHYTELSIGNQKLIDSDNSFCKECLKQPINLVPYPINGVLTIFCSKLLRNTGYTINIDSFSKNITVNGLVTFGYTVIDHSDVIYNFGIRKCKVDDIVTLTINSANIMLNRSVAPDSRHKPVIEYKIQLAQSYWSPPYGWLFERDHQIRTELLILKLCLNKMNIKLSKDTVLYIGRFLI